MKKIFILFAMLTAIMSIHLSAFAACDVDGHVYGTPHMEDETPANCTEDGFYYSVRKCTVCAYEDKTKITIPSSGHTKSAEFKENVIEATCSSAGSYDSVFYCTVCKQQISRDKVDVPQLSHSFVEKEEKAATCAEPGVKTLTCSKCGHVDYAVIPAKAHTPGGEKHENETAPSCTAEGKYDSVVYCTECKQQISREAKTVPALGHDYIGNICSRCKAEKPAAGITDVELSRGSITIIKGSSSTVGAGVIPASVSCSISISSDNSAVAEVSAASISSGGTFTVTGKSRGKAIITAMATDPVTGKVYQDICEVVVTEESLVCSVTYLPGIYSTGSPYSYSIPYGSPVYAIDNLFSRPGYRQDGWLINGSGTVYRNGSFIGAAYGDITLYPNWVANTQSYTLTVTYNNSLGSVYTGNSYVPSGTQYTIGPDTSITFTFAPAKGYYVYDCKLQNLRSYGSMDAFTVTSTRMAGANRNLVIDLRSIYDRPKTGDDSNIILWLSLAGVALVGGGVTMLVIKKKKK